MKATVVFYAVAGLLACLPLVTRANTLVAPFAYSFDQATDCGAYCYYDDTGSQLTDGVIGVAGWGINSDRWVGWALKPTINIDFDFGWQNSFTAVSVGSTQDSTYGSLRLPDVVVSSWDGSNWVQQGSLDITFSTSDDKDWKDGSPHTWLTVSDLNFNADKVRVTLSSNGGNWVFADEVQFTATPVPEPEIYALMLAGLGLVGFAARRRKAQLLY